MKASFLANTNSEEAIFEWSPHNYLIVTQSLGIHGLPEPVGRAIAEAYAKAVKEWESGQ